MLKSESENDLLDFLSGGDKEKSRSKSIPSDVNEDTVADKSKKPIKKVTIAPTPEGNQEVDNQEIETSPKLRGNQDSSSNNDSPSKRGKTPPQVPPRNSDSKKANDSKRDSFKNKEPEQKVESIKDEKKTRKDTAERSGSPDENIGRESSASSPLLSSNKKGKKKPDVPPRQQTPKSKHEADDSIGNRKSSGSSSKRNASISSQQQQGI